MRRFIIGDNQTQGYTFSHPKLGQYFWDELLDSERTDLENRFIVWGDSTLQSMIIKKNRPFEVPSYLINYYCAHLNRAHAPLEKFILLVKHPEWAQACYTEGTYGGFFRDLEIILRHIDEAILNSITENSQEKRKIAFIGQIRCGLCYSSIMTLSRNVSIDLLPLALEYGLISQTQALEIAKGIQKDEMFLHVLDSLLPLFDNRMVGIILNIIQDIPSEKVRIEALINLYPYLSNELRIETYNTIHSIKDHKIKANSIARIAQFYPGEFAQKILSDIESMNGSYEKVVALIKISEQFLGEVKGKIIDLAINTGLSINSANDLAMALIYLLPYVKNKNDDGLMETVLQTAIKAINSPNYELVQARYFKQIAPYLDEKHLETVLHHAWALERTDAKIDALAGIIPYLPVGLKQDNMVKALKEAQSINTPEKYPSVPIPGMAIKSQAKLRGPIPRMGRTFTGGRTGSLLDLLPVLSNDLKQETVQSIISSINELLDDYAKSVYLVELLECLPDHEKKVAIELTSTIRSVDDRAHALYESASYLSSPLLELLLHNVLLLESQDTQAYVLASIASFFPEDRKKDITKKASDMVFNSKDEYVKGKTLAILIPNLPLDLRKTTLRKALKIMEKVNDKFSQSLALTLLTAFMPNELRNEIMQIVYDLVLNISRDDDRAEAIIKLLPYIHPEMKVKFLHEVVFSVKAILSDDDRAYLIADIVPHIPGELILEVLQIALDIINEPSRGYALSVLAFCLPEHVLPKLIRDALNMNNVVARLYVLARIFPKISNYQREELLYIVLNNLEAIVDERYRANAISDFAPYFGTAELQQAIIIAGNIKDTASRVQALSKLASYLDIERRCITIQNALNAIGSIIDEYSRAQAIENVSSLLIADQKVGAIEIAKSIKFDNYRLMSLYAIAPYLTNSSEHDLLLDAIGEIRDGYAAMTLGDMAKFVLENKRSNLLSLVKKIQNNETRAFALKNIVPFLEGKEKEDAVQLAQESTDNYEQDRYKVEHLINLVPHISGDKKYKLLQLAFHKSAELDESWLTPLAGKLAEYSIEWFNKEPIDAISAWLVFFHAIIKFNREEHLHLLSTLFPLLIHFNFDLQSDFVKNASISIQEVCSWWP